MPEVNPPQGERIISFDELAQLTNPASSADYHEHFVDLMNEIVPVASLLQPAREELLALPPAQVEPDHPTFMLLRVYTNRVSDDRMKQAAIVLVDDKLTANEKLTKIDELMPFPPTASAEQLGEMLGVSKQAVMKTVWWRNKRRGETDEEIERRHAQHKDRGKRIDRPRSDDGEDDR